MLPEIHPRFFAVLGLLLGALYGFVFSVWKPPVTALITDLYNPVMWAIVILGFFVLQYGLGVVLRKPSISREIYYGLFLIPAAYTVSMLTLSVLGFVSTFVAVMIPAIVLFLASFYVVSPFIAFFAGVDTRELDEAEIPVETVFSFDIQPSTGQEERNLELLTRMVHGMGFVISLDDVKRSHGWLICRKERLHLGVFYEFKNRILTATFVPFRIVNDTVKKFEELDALLDLKAQISGMLYAWMQNNLIIRFNEVLPNLEVGFKKISKALGPLKTPLAVHVKETIVSFPKDHPYQLALLSTGAVIIVNVLFFILGRLVFK